MSNHTERNGGLAAARTTLDGITAAYVAHSWLMNDARMGNDLTPAARSLLRELSRNGEDFDDIAEVIEERCREQSLSVTIRDGWRNPGEASEPMEFCILLTTGGPAVRIVGGLGRYNEPESPDLQGQDWFTSWESIETTSEEDEALSWFCSLFYYGEE
jgi:hypothetical protein